MMAGSLSQLVIASGNSTRLSPGPNTDRTSWFAWLSVASGICTVGALVYLIQTAPCRALQTIKHEVKLLKQLRLEASSLGTAVGALKERRRVAAERGDADVAMLDSAIQLSEADATSAEAAATSQCKKVHTMVNNYKKRFGSVEDAMFAILGDFLV
jgi:hypothetical protein